MCTGELLGENRIFACVTYHEISSFIDPKIDESKLIGNGAGKLKYGHKIHYNGVQDQFGEPHFYSMTAFLTMIMLSVQLYL